MSKNFSFKNEYHLGDCLYQLHYQLQLYARSYVASTLYCAPEYHAELLAFIPTGADVRVKAIEDAPADAINTWIGHKDFHIKHPNWHAYDAFYVDFFRSLSAQIGVHCPITSTQGMLFSSRCILERQIDKTHYDFLIINAEPLSNQFDFKSCDWMNLVMTLKNARKTVITTHPCGIQNIPATTNLGYKVADIAKLSTQVKNIIAIDTGPVGSTFNIWNQTTVKNRFILHKTNYFTHGGCHHIKEWAELRPALSRSECLRVMTT